jgi:ABC-type amino acid transport substrate-binding protein
LRRRPLACIGAFETSAKVCRGPDRTLALIAPKARWLALAFALAVVVGVVWFARSRETAPDLSLERVQSAGTLVVGLDPSYPPFEVDTGQGQIVGFDVDVATEIAQRMGVRVRFVSIDFGSIFDALDVGKFDAIIGGVSPFPEYVKVVDYSIPYYDDGQVLVANPRAGSRIVGIESGSDADLDQDEIRPKLSGYQLRQFDDQTEIHDALAKRQLGGAIVDAVTGIEWAHGIPELVVQQQRLTTTPFVLAVRRSDQKLLRAIDAQIGAMQASGEIGRLERRWFEQ